jgi:type IV pilus biogenesis protein PilP
VKSRSKLILMALIYAAACLGLAWWLVPEPQLEKDLTAPEQAWQLPEIPERPVDQAHAYLQKQRPWGGKGAIVAAGGTSTSWRLRGIVREGQRLFALVEIDGKVMRFERGQTLPGDQQLVRIEADRVVVTSDEGGKIYRLYPSEDR